MAAADDRRAPCPHLRGLPGFVEFVERGQTTGDEITVLAERLLAPVGDAEVDTLLLGCTHYPYLARVISEVMGRECAWSLGRRDRVRVVPASPARALRAATPRAHRFLSTGDVAWFADLGGRLLGPELDAAERHPGVVPNACSTSRSDRPTTPRRPP